MDMLNDSLKKSLRDANYNQELITLEEKLMSALVSIALCNNDNWTIFQ